jgi:hypothetical protein
LDRPPASAASAAPARRCCGRTRLHERESHPLQVPAQRCRESDSRQTNHYRHDAKTLSLKSLHIPRPVQHARCPLMISTRSSPPTVSDCISSVTILSPSETEASCFFSIICRVGPEPEITSVFGGGPGDHVQARNSCGRPSRFAPSSPPNRDIGPVTCDLRR